MQKGGARFRAYSSEMRLSSDFVVFCFAKPEKAQAFCDRFGGERLGNVKKAR